MGYNKYVYIWLSYISIKNIKNVRILSVTHYLEKINIRGRRPHTDANQFPRVGYNSLMLNIKKASLIGLTYYFIYDTIYMGL